jgi:hypothetical protein
VVAIATLFFPNAQELGQMTTPISKVYSLQAGKRSPDSELPFTSGKGAVDNFFRGNGYSLLKERKKERNLICTTCQSSKNPLDSFGSPHLPYQLGSSKLNVPLKPNPLMKIQRSTSSSADNSQRLLIVFLRTLLHSCKFISFYGERIKEKGHRSVFLFFCPHKQKKSP